MQLRSRGPIIVVVILILLVYEWINRIHFKRELASPLNISMTPSVKDWSPNSILGYKSYSDEITRQFRLLAERKAPANDPELVAFVRKIIRPPSHSKMIKMSRPLMKTPQAREIDILLKEKTKGFFVEAGALDGERSSNSIFFEMKRDWTGILVEPDPYFYTQLVGKNRNCWSINACLATTPFASEVVFLETGDGRGKLSKSDKISPGSKTVPCIPLETLLTAVNATIVDYFSLDVEGFELQILKTIPMDKINITILSVEFVHGDEKEYTKFMESSGYKMVRKLQEKNPEVGLYVEDLLFVKNEK